jgi:signal transduction histidine kinase
MSYDEYLLSAEFYANKIETILLNGLEYSHFINDILENITEYIKPREVLNEILIPEIIEDFLLTNIEFNTTDDFDELEKTVNLSKKNEKVFPIEFILDDLHQLDYSFKSYLLDINKSINDIDKDDLTEYMNQLRISNGFRDLVERLSNETSKILLHNQDIIKQVISFLPWDSHFFKPRARLLLQLGDQLIKDEGVALFELVKNSYDADSTFSDVYLNDIDKKTLGSIFIKDNGSGMNYKLITEHWLEPGTDLKEKLIEKKVRSELYKRLPLGEKGIGRFGSHKLGQVITIYTKTDFDNEVKIHIDWKDFEEEEYLDTVPINIIENTERAEYFTKSIQSISQKDYISLSKKIDKQEHIDFLKSLYDLKNEHYILNKDIKRNKEQLYNELKKILNLYGYYTSGTYIKITNLWENWTRGMLRSTFRAVNAINSPFDSHKTADFRVNIKTNKNDWLEKLLTTEEVVEKSLFEINGDIEHGKINLTYNFTPFEKMDKVGKRSLKKEIELIEKIKIFDNTKNKYVQEKVCYALEDYGIGRIDFQFYIYDLGNEVAQFIRNDISGLKLFLKQNGGIRIYRDKIRVYDYGEPGNDWLKLDFKRVSNPTQMISNNQLLGAIYLDRDTSKNLIEKTNREGFIINESYEKFAQSISQLVSEIAVERGIDKELIKHHYGPKNSQEPVISSINKLSNYVDRNVENENIKNSIKKQLLEIEEEYSTMTENLLSAAGSGLTMNVALHEIEKVVYELIKRSDDNEFHNDVKLLIDNLHTTILTYSSLTKINKDETVSLKDAIKKLQDVNFYRVALHNITLIDNTVNLKDDIKVKFTEKLLIASLSNILDNSIYWLEEKAKDEKEFGNTNFEKKIFIDVTYDISKYPTIVIADNGKGFGSMPTDLARKAYTTNKKVSMGLGLYIIDETMKLHDSRLLFPEIGDVGSIPDDITRAIVALEIGGNK